MTAAAAANLDDLALGVHALAGRGGDLLLVVLVGAVFVWQVGGEK